MIIPASNTPAGQPDPLYYRVGGEEFFTKLVDEFYAGVADDAELLALYPEPDDLEPAKERLRLFLIQYWGGPTTYNETRGHPRLRMRHVPYVIAEPERDTWLRHMYRAVDASEVNEPERSELNNYFAMAAQHMVNAH